MSGAPSSHDYGRLFTISNVLSMCRAVLAMPFAMVMLSDLPHATATAWGVGILVIATLTDKFDGVLARKLNQVTEWGKILDPVADKIGIAVVALVLVKLGLMPLWFVLAVVGRDVVILAGGLHVKSKKAVVPQSNELGKWTIGALAATMFVAMMRWEMITQVFLWLSTLMLAGSFVLYLIRYIGIVRTQS